MSCESSCRRTFLRQSGCGLLSLALLGLGESAGALPVTTIEATGSDVERRFPIPSTDGVSIDRRAQIILVRYANHVYAMARTLRRPEEFCARVVLQDCPHLIVRVGGGVLLSRRRPAIRANLACVRCAQRFGPVFHTEEHAPCHEESRRFDRVRGQPGPGAPCAHTAARHQSRSLLVDCKQAELPHPIKAAHVPHVQHECASGLDGCHRPARASSERNLVADGKVLKLWKNAGCTRAIEIAEEPIEPIVAVQAATLIADLHEPGPDVFWRRVDGDGDRP